MNHFKRNIQIQFKIENSIWNTFLPSHSQAVNNSLAKRIFPITIQVAVTTLAGIGNVSINICHEIETWDFAN